MQDSIHKGIIGSQYKAEGVSRTGAKLESKRETKLQSKTSPTTYAQSQLKFVVFIFYYILIAVVFLISLTNYIRYAKIDRPHYVNII